MKVFTLVVTKCDETRVGVYSPECVDLCWADAANFLEEGWNIGVNWQDVVEKENDEE